jgi:hypothetical protein
VHSKAASDRGIQAYTKLRGLIIVQHETAMTLPAGPGRPGPSARPAASSAGSAAGA